MSEYNIQQEPEPLMKSGVKFSLYRMDGTPMYMSEGTKEALMIRALQSDKDAVFHEYHAMPTADELGCDHQWVTDVIREPIGLFFPVHSDFGLADRFVFCTHCKVKASDYLIDKAITEHRNSANA